MVQADILVFDVLVTSDGSKMGRMRPRSGSITGDPRLVFCQYLLFGVLETARPKYFNHPAVKFDALRRVVALMVADADCVCVLGT